MIPALTTSSGSADALVVVVPLLGPLAAAATGAIMGWRRATGFATIGAAGIILVAGVAAAIRTVDGTALAVGGWLRIDALSALMLIVIGAVGLIATFSSLTHLDRDLESGRADDRGARVYGVLVPLFLAAMVLAVLANNLGLLWAAIETTTIVTAFLVGHRRTRSALEATWKYVIICSVGIALAYLGTVLVNYAAQQAGIAEHGTLDWTELSTRAGELDPGVMRLAFALLVLGFGAKAGMIPLHSWLPDAHSQAPAPVSALMSGVLLPVAVYALLRYRVIAIGSIDATFVRALLLTIAVASLLLATSLMLTQRDYKRLLAYSSIEHMALVIIGVAAGTPLALAAALLHIVGHGISKAVLFCSAGEILSRTGTTVIADVRNLLTRAPVLGGVFGIGLAALLGLPPFSLFFSEIALVRAGLAAGLGWVVAGMLVLLLMVFVAIAVKGSTMLFGAPTDRLPTTSPALTTLPLTTAAPVITGLCVVAALGIADWPLGPLLHSASMIAGTP